MAVLVDDGRICLRVVEPATKNKQSIVCHVEVGGEISNHKGVNMPDAKLPLSSMTEKDKADLQFGMSLGFEFISLSFVQRAKDIEDARALIGNIKRPKIKIPPHMYMIFGCWTMKSYENIFR